MANFGARMGATAVQVDNHPTRANTKIALRRKLLEAVDPFGARVFDAFAGSDTMYRAVWQHAASYTACDKRRFGGHRRAYVADNLRVLRAIDLVPFNVFDLDAYGSPWKQATIIAARRQLAPGERFGLVLTDGASMRARLGMIEASLAAMAGVSPKVDGMATRWRELTARALGEMADRMGGTVTEFWAADMASAVLYSAAVFVGRADQILV